LLQTINSYLMYGKDFFEDSVDNLSQIFSMAIMSMCRTEQPIILGNNMEGALLLHMTLQNLDGTLIKDAIGDILTNVYSRLKSEPMSTTFRRVLLEVFYSAMLVDVDKTLQVIQQMGFLEEFFKMAFESWRGLRLSYERKLFTLAMTNLMFHTKEMPAQLQN
jgi:hypothetical protein